jgi:hypothetical protein
MHALHLPHRHLWRVALLGLALAFAMTLVLQVGRLDIGLPGGSTPAAAPAPPPPPPPTKPAKPDWLTNPLAPVTFHLR